MVTEEVYQQTKSMNKKIGKWLILLPISVLMLVFCISLAEARGGSFVIGSMQGAVENVDLGISDQVFGNLSVSDGCIDFFIVNPSGVTVQTFQNVTGVSFNFEADENGNYSMRLNNTYQAHDVTVELKYGVNMIVTSQVNMNVGISSGVAHVVSITLPPPPEQPDEQDDYVVGPYLNFLRAADILKTATNARTVLPIRNVTLMSCIASLVGMAIILNIKARRPDFHTHSHVYTAPQG